MFVNLEVSLQVCIGYGFTTFRIYAKKFCDFIVVPDIQQNFIISEKWRKISQ